MRNFSKALTLTTTVILLAGNSFAQIYTLDIRAFTDGRDQLIISQTRSSGTITITRRLVELTDETNPP